MTQGILITAYKDESMLLRLIRHFSGPSFRVFVHIDKKSRELSLDRLKALKQPNLEVISKFKITWGSINHVKAVLELIRISLRYSDIEYYHLISGSDMPLHSPSWFVSRFEKDRKSYFSNGTLPVLNREHTRVWRTKFWLPSVFDPRSIIVKMITKALFWLQVKLNVERKALGEIAMKDVRFGMIWSSFSRGGGGQFLEFAATHPRFMRALNFTMVPEEAFFVTALMGTSYQPDDNSTDLRYYEWTREMPAVLDETDFNKVVDSRYIFARKMDSVKSAKLIDLIEQKIARENES